MVLQFFYQFKQIIMKKSERIFYKHKKHEIENLSKENKPTYSWITPSPIFIPKRKKKK